MTEDNLALENGGGLRVTGDCSSVVLPFGAMDGSSFFWAAQEQREFQNVMAMSLRTIRSGDSFAISALCRATATYAFVCALGPGHGKVLLGRAALASGATLRRMAVLTLASGLAQSASAIALVTTAAFVLGWATRDLVGLTEAWFALASAMAIAAIGLLLVVRGLRARQATRPKAENVHNDHDQHHDHSHLRQNQSHDVYGCGACRCGYAHGPTTSEVQSLT